MSKKLLWIALFSVLVNAQTADSNTRFCKGVTAWCAARCANSHEPECQASCQQPAANLCSNPNQPVMEAPREQQLPPAATTDLRADDVTEYVRVVRLVNLVGVVFLR